GAWKGHENLIEAFQTVIQRCPDAQLHIFGKGAAEFEAELRSRARNLGMQASVFWRGFVEDRDTIYSDLTLLVIPSRFEEPFGLTAVEASFHAVPVVAARRGGLPEIIEDGVTGFLFEAGNV